MTSTEVRKVTVRVSKIPGEYLTSDYKWLHMDDKEYLLASTSVNIENLKRDKRVIVHRNETYRFL